MGGVLAAHGIGLLVVDESPRAEPAWQRPDAAAGVRVLAVAYGLDEAQRRGLAPMLARCSGPCTTCWRPPGNRARFG